MENEFHKQMAEDFTYQTPWITGMLFRSSTKSRQILNHTNFGYFFMRS